jgi:hypothetical protein
MFLMLPPWIVLRAIVARERRPGLIQARHFVATCHENTPKEATQGKRKNASADGRTAPPTETDRPFAH